LVLAAELEKLDPVYDEKAGPDIITTTAYFRSEAMPIINQRQVKQNLSKATAKITKRLEEFTNEGSGWRLKRCARVDLGIVQYRPFRGRSYIKTPAYISGHQRAGTRTTSPSVEAGGSCNRPAADS